MSFNCFLDADKKPEASPSTWLRLLLALLILVPDFGNKSGHLVRNQIA